MTHDTTLEYNGFKATHIFDDQLNAFHGRVVGIEDVVDFWGDTMDELIAEFHTSVNKYVEWCREEEQKQGAP